jgi:hypothetical protein
LCPNTEGGGSSNVSTNSSAATGAGGESGGSKINSTNISGASADMWGGGGGVGADNGNGNGNGNGTGWVLKETAVEGVKRRSMLSQIASIGGDCLATTHIMVNVIEQVKTWSIVY